MATSRNFLQFARRIHFVATEFEHGTENTLKRAALAADQALVLNTPVDTGRARANWIVSIGSPSGDTFGFTGGEAEATNQALEQGRSTIDGYKLGKGAIFISNNLPYIQRLDAGYSMKAPQGMTEQALAAALREISNARIL